MNRLLCKIGLHKWSEYTDTPTRFDEHGKVLQTLGPNVWLRWRVCYRCEQTASFGGVYRPQPLPFERPRR